MDWSSLFQSPIFPQAAPQAAQTYDTQLTPQQQEVYDSRFSPNDSRDYDMTGWFLQNQNAPANAQGVHYPDTFKKPNHITFSDQSKYSTPQMQGGQWTQAQDGSWAFTPSAFNLTQHTPEELRAYFKQYEEPLGNKLNLP